MATYYVDGLNGSDANGGSSVADAWKTLSTAFGYLSYIAGDILVIMNTVDYDLSGGLTLPAANILITGGNSSGNVDGTKAVIKWIDVSNNYMLTMAGTIRLTNLSFKTSIAGIGNAISVAVGTLYLRQSEMIDLNLGLGPNGTGNTTGSILDVFFQGVSTVATGNANRARPSFHYCKFDNCSSINPGAGNSVQYYFCQFYNGSGSIGGTNYASPVIENCLFDGSGIIIGDRATSTLTPRIYNNIFINVNIAINWVSGNNSIPSFLNNNCFYNVTTELGTPPEGVEVGSASITADPLFVDSANGNYTLQSNSPLIGAGIDGTTIGPIPPSSLGSPSPLGERVTIF